MPHIGKGVALLSELGYRPGIFSTRECASASHDLYRPPDFFTPAEILKKFWAGPDSKNPQLTFNLFNLDKYLVNKNI
jgi:hypothetical protein